MDTDEPDAQPSAASALDGAPVAVLLEQLASGDTRAAERLYPAVYRELHDIAHRMMGRERRSHTLQTTALVHEAWLRLRPGEDAKPATRAQFFSFAIHAMRRVLVDHARKKLAKKRDGGMRHELFDEILAGWGKDPSELLALDEALDRLEQEGDVYRRVVELRFFGGLSLEETGALLGMTVRQVHRRWTFARGWLRQTLGGEGGLDA